MEWSIKFHLIVPLSCEIITEIYAIFIPPGMVLYPQAENCFSGNHLLSLILLMAMDWFSTTIIHVRYHKKKKDIYPLLIRK